MRDQRPDRDAHHAIADLEPIVANASPVEPQRATLRQNFAKMPLYFTENRGQMSEQVAYYVQGADKALYFTSQGLTVSLAGGEKQARYNLKLDFVDANRVRPEGQEQAEAVVSYFRGARPEWKSGLKTYRKVVYRELWPGIDLVYSGTVNRMKYHFVVAPGADASRIRLAYRGATAQVNASGELEVSTPAGSFKDEAPVSSQRIDGRQREVETKFRLQGDGATYGFELGEYDRGEALEIDPAVLVYAGFIGGSQDDQANAIAVDAQGNVYVTGVTYSANETFPEAVGPALSNGGQGDAFVAKVSADGRSLIYCGYLGGGARDEGRGIAVDSAGRAYLAGVTSSDGASGFPAVIGPDTSYNGGGSDGFVAMVEANGLSLGYSGYVGGSGVDAINAVAVDGTGNMYVTGYTESTQATFPVVAGPDLTYNGGAGDAFITKVIFGGDALVYSGYIGGSEMDEGQGIALDANRNAYVAGQTRSTSASFPVQYGPDLSFNGDVDAFVTKVAADGINLIYSGYIGGTGTDSASAVVVDGTGCAYIGGSTNSPEANFPVAIGPDLSFNGGEKDGFVAKVKADGLGVAYNGYIGGAGADIVSGLALDKEENLYVTGSTNSSDASFPVVNGLKETYNGGASDAFVAQVKAGGGGIGFNGFLGGNNSDYGRGIAVNPKGIYVVGVTSSNHGFPALIGPDTTANGGMDAFVTKLAMISAPSFEKKFGAASIMLNGTTKLTFTLSNSNPEPIENVGFTDNFPAGLAFANPSNLTNTCDGMVMLNETAGSLTLSDGVIPGSGSCQIAVDVKGIKAGPQVNVTGPLTFGSGANVAPATATVKVYAAPQIAMSFDSQSIPVNANSKITYTITNPNPGLELTNVSFNHSLPFGLVVATPNGLANSCGGTVATGLGLVNLGGAKIPPGGFCTLSLNLTGTIPGDKENRTSNIKSAETEAGNAASATITVVGPPSVSVKFDTVTVPLGGSTTITVVIRNTNQTVNLTNVHFVDVLPAGVVVSAAPVLTNTCPGTPEVTGGAPKLTVQIEQLSAGADCTFSTSVTGMTAGPKENASQEVTSSNGGSSISNPAHLIVVAPPSIHKFYAAPTFPLNQTIGLSYIITNPNTTVPLTGVAFTDTLPSGLVLATPNGLTGTCSGAVTAPAGGNNVNFNGGTISAGGTCSLTVFVKGVTPGTKDSRTSAITSTNGGAGNWGTAAVTVVAPPTVSAMFIPSSIKLGQHSTLLLTVSNPNASVTLTGVGITSNMATGAGAATSPPTSSGCGTPTIQSAGGGRTITMSNATIRPGATCQISLKVNGTTTGSKTSILTPVTSANGGAGNSAAAILFVQ